MLVNFLFAVQFTGTSPWRTCLFDLTLYIHGKQLGSCRNGRLLNCTATGLASWKQLTSILVSILSPVTDNLLFVNQRRNRRWLET